MKTRFKAERFALPALLCVFVAVALTYSVVIPLGEAPDEVPHWSYVQYLVQNQRLPLSEGAVSGESHQPPLYYLIGALATFWLPQSEFTSMSRRRRISCCTRGAKRFRIKALRWRGIGFGCFLW
jgi:hypothetical protein